jgi:hypothetical protein
MKPLAIAILGCGALMAACGSLLPEKRTWEVLRDTPACSSQHLLQKYETGLGLTGYAAQTLDLDEVVEGGRCIKLRLNDVVFGTHLGPFNPYVRIERPDGVYIVNGRFLRAQF